MAQEQQREEFLIRDKDTGQARPYYVSAENINLGDDETYKSLPDVLDEMQDEIDQAGQGDGTVTGVKVGSTPYNPDLQGVVDLSTPFAGKVDKDPNKELIPSTDLAKLQNLPTADQLTQQLGQKANDADVVKSVTVNGTAQPKDGNGVVSLTIGTGGPNDIVDISTTQQGTIIFTRRNDDTVTVDLNHVHPQYVVKKTVESNANSTVTLSADVIYDLGTVSGDKVINLPSTVDQAADYEFRLNYTSGTISGTAISGTTVANDATLAFTAGKTYQVIISGGILYFSETTVPT